MQSIDSGLYKTKNGELIPSHLDPLPNDSACSECGYFDTDHPGVKAILIARAARLKPLQQKQLWIDAQCKCPKRKQEALHEEGLRYSFANLPRGESQKTFDNFLPRAGTETMLEAAKAFVSQDSPVRLLTIQGVWGNGKTHILEAMAREFLNAGHRVKFELTKDFLDRLRRSYSKRNSDDFDSVLSEYKTAYALFLDDLGAESDTDYGISQLTGLIEYRIQRNLYIAVTTNSTRTDMMETNPRLADRIFATNTALVGIKVVSNTATSYRK